MVNDIEAAPTDLRAVRAAIWTYVGIVVATVVVLVVLTAAAPHLATREAWGHALVVAAFAVLLPLRLRAARRGSVRAVRAIGVIATVVAAVNVVEACLPAFPGWMRGQMVVVAAVMLVLLGCVVRAARRRVA
ncbi:hypothetical protein [Actinocatenispora rupis]|uniref:Uncharacterized protein n=1 Tax=Actinocatenispora rupis TaxID=519421 RepID=A0A8J3J4D0_9ACTN|nr:hypothetical protein [Actinocatenispora rupis]GID09894.1 hypothetical protein Aru02nite_07830 [Actinocatenispora rupis]